MLSALGTITQVNKMSEKVFAKLHGEVVHMVAHGDYLYIAAIHLGQTVIYQIDVDGNKRKVEIPEGDF